MSDVDSRLKVTYTFVGEDGDVHDLAQEEISAPRDTAPRETGADEPEPLLALTLEDLRALYRLALEKHMTYVRWFQQNGRVDGLAAEAIEERMIETGRLVARLSAFSGQG